MLDDSQASTLVLGDMTADEERNIQWTVRAIPQEENRTVSYSIAFYSGSQLLKTMELDLDLGALSEEDAYRTVTFDLNGGDGEAPAPQRVKIGTYVTEPDAPTREGYVFRGWYANKNGTGQKWFSIFNLYLGQTIEEDTTLYAIWKEDTRTLDYGWDTYQFINTDSAFSPTASEHMRLPATIMTF